MFDNDGCIIVSPEVWKKLMAELQPSGLYCQCGEPLMKTGPVLEAYTGRKPFTYCKECDFKAYAQQAQGSKE